MLRKALLLCLILTLAAPAAAQSAAGDLLGRINALRASLGLPGYTLNGALSAAAQSQAAWMAETGTISHTRPDGSGPRTRAVNAGYGTTDVAENIYGGTNATVGTAWSFWVNSAIHYAGLTNPRYQEVGIGVANGSGLTTYVLVFGNPGGPPPFVPQAASVSASGAGGGGSAAPPSYVVGIDEQGFIMHQIQPGDTLGDIALLYGYTWDDLPYMREVNNIEDHFSLSVGEVFLVPPHDGTFTPTPGDTQPEPTPTPNAAEPTATVSPSPTLTPTATRMMVATAAVMPELLALPPEATATPTAAAVAIVPTPVEVIASGVQRSQGPSSWLVVGLVLQAGLVALAGFEFVRRAWRKGR